MECKNCKYFSELNHDFYCGRCDITNVYNTKSCTLSSDEDVEHLPICYNCQHWYGGGDWGLSCAKHYYNCSNNGFDKACEQFEGKKQI